MVRPDWVCEILSTNKRNDLILKKRVYHRHQIPHYWIIDPERETLMDYRWAQDGYVEILAAGRGEEVCAEPFEAIQLQVGVLFGMTRRRRRPCRRAEPARELRERDAAGCASVSTRPRGAEAAGSPASRGGTTRMRLAISRLRE